MINKKKKRTVSKKEHVKKSRSIKSKKHSPLRFNLIALLVIIVAGYLAYSNSLNGEMIYDDLRSIQNNEKLHDFDNIKVLKNWINPNQRQFAKLTFTLNYSIHENNVFGYHLFNLIVHIIYGFFVFLLAKLLLSLNLFDNNPLRKQTTLMALFIALICILHPIQTQAVSYIVQRMASMSTMFYIMSIYFYGKGRLQYVKEGLNKGVFLLYLFSLLSGILGILSKQIVATLPAAILLFELFFIRNKEGAIFKKYLVFAFSFMAALCLIIIFSGLLPKETENITRSEYLYTQSRVIIKYIQLLLFPVNQTLNYDFVISTRFFEWKVIVSSLIIIGLIILAFLLYKKKHLISFGIFWFFLTLLIESSLIPIIDVIFEHRLYLPMFGFSLIFVSLIWDFLAKKRMNTVIIFFIALCITYAILTYERNKVWKTQISLWTDNIDKYPGDKVAYMNRALAYNQQGRYNEAIADYNTGIKLDSNNYQFYINKGLAHKIMKQYELAILDFSEAIEKRKPDNYQPYLERGIIYTDYLKQYDTGIKDFMTCLSHDANHADATINLAVAYYQKNIYDSAMVYCQKSMELTPENGNTYYIAALISASKNEFGQAYEYLIKAKSLGYPVQEPLIKDWSKRASDETSAGNTK